MSRFSIAYMPLFAILTAAGIPQRGRSLAVGALTSLMIVWTWPALRVVHTTDSPPVAAIESLRGFRGRMEVDERLAAHIDALSPGLARRVVRVHPPFVADPSAAILREGASAAPGARNFSRDRERLGAIARQRYFEVSVIPGRRVEAP